jgi:SRSO17 transposase
VDVVRVEQLRGQLLEFVEDVFASLTRAGWQERGECYLRGLMLDGKRKSIQPMAARLPQVHEQALNHFVTVSPWDPVPVRRRLAQRMSEAIDPQAWVFDDTGALKSGNASPCVARQYTGTAGKVTNCQVAVSVHLAADQASCPANWRLFVPERWDPSSPKATADVAVRRAKAGIPDEVRHREKWRLGLDMLDEMTGWGLTPPLAVADSGYGEIGEFRQGLEDRAVPYVVQVAHTVTAYPETATRTAPPYSGNGPRPRAIYRDAAPTVKDLILTAGHPAARQVTWRQGSRRRSGKPQPMRSHFLFLRVRPASNAHRRAHRGKDLPVRWLIAEWPPDQPEPTKYWISDLPTATPRTRLIRLAKLRWRIEHDYRELKDGLGLDHYEGRTWHGWHHHVTLVSAAHAFCTLQRLTPKAAAPA